MKHFAELFEKLDQTTKINEKVGALEDYFLKSEDADKLWAIALFSNRRPRRTVNTDLLREWAAEHAQIPLWLFEESYHVVGDLAETIALVLPGNSKGTDRTLSEWVQGIRELADRSEEDKKKFIRKAWSELNETERFLFNKLITGGFRVGVSKKLVIRALSRILEEDENVIAHRLMGNWDPDKTTFSELLVKENQNDDISKPYPFFLAYALEKDVEDLGNPDDWQAEEKWDGIRCQFIKRRGNLFIWSRGEELVTDKYPEFESILDIEPDDFVVDGEILPFKDDQPLSFQELQTRIGRKRITKSILLHTPVILMAYDLLEYRGTDIRKEMLDYRRMKLKEVFREGNNYSIDLPWKISREIKFNNWSELKKVRENSRIRKTEGIVLKRKESEYESGRKRGDWWKWKIDPLTIDAVMLYAMRGHGRRANLYTDFTFAVWDGNQLVPFTKAYSGLTDDEFIEITRYVQKYTLDRYGPVRAVKPNLVFEIAFEGINRSKRHKSGVALRFPRIKRWRKDKHPKDANTLEDLNSMLERFG